MFAVFICICTFGVAIFQKYIAYQFQILNENNLKLLEIYCDQIITTQELVI